MGLLSWLFGSKPTPKPKSSPRRKAYGFDEKLADHKADVIGYKKSSLCIRRIKIIVDKQDLDACAAIKRMKKVHDINEVPPIPLDREKCQHCTCYYEPVLPKDY